MNYILPIITVIAGFGIVILLKPQIKLSLKLLLAFSGAFLLSLTVFHLLPEVYHHGNARTTGICIMMGILLQIFLEFFSKGAEHGHMHHHSEKLHFPWLLFISLSIHAILEGFPIHSHDSLIYGIIVHKLPIAIILTTFFLEANISKPKVAAFLILFSLMTPLGTLLADIIPLFKTFYVEVSAIVIGIFLHISTTILFESSEGHKFNASKLFVIIMGILTAYII
ncbi:ZIP family metal transporter [Zhouia spongiae]|uniref:ZIP family metal transporter n=1 Tax=Zhouia spongiae TaxID=2202721 RepID=A0ABY3YSA6_9FLAO|nr:ZIP family metal transporter [Zhouia spongiae]UNZ00481.1 ZIP family metal transporter [Zhouia spongiae]